MKKECLIFFWWHLAALANESESEQSSVGRLLIKYHSKISADTVQIYI